MADIVSILSNSYTTAPVPSLHTAYVRVDPTLYDGTWKGVYSTGEKFSFTISGVQGFHAKVQFQTGNGPIKFQDVLIKDNSFRIADTKFLLKKVRSRGDQVGRHESSNGRLCAQHGLCRSRRLTPDFA
jgi:hypothetical protein